MASLTVVDAEKQCGGGDIQPKLALMRDVSVATLTIGVVVFAFGFPTIILVAPSVPYPWSSGTGIYTGLVTALAGLFGRILAKEFLTGDPKSIRCYYITFRVFLQISISIAGYYMATGIQAAIRCSLGPTDEKCGGVNWSGNYVLAVVNSVLGGTVIIMSLTLIFVSCKLYHTFQRKAGCC